ncbi:MAG: LytTR family DNA-binding domain-containing protein [Rikenellaceae bacterium]
MKLKTIVIDDEPLALALIESYVAKTPYLEHIASFSSGVEALHSGRLVEADLIFLDIQMPTLNGLELSRVVDPKSRIVFTTAFGEYALDGYKVNALDYLLKPISYLDFLSSASKALSWFELLSRGTAGEDDIESIYVKSEYKLLRIELKSLLYVEGLKDYVKFYVEGESAPILSLMNIKRAMELLPEQQFIRVNRSYIVRKDKIKIIERSRIIIDEKPIPIGDVYKQELQEYLKVRIV